MTKEEVIDLLRHYKANLAMCRLHNLNTYEIIEAMQLQAAYIKDIPPSNTNKFNSVTENSAIQLDEEKLKEYEMIKRSYQNVRKVQILLDSLTNEQRFILESHWILRVVWERMPEQYKTMFGEWKSSKQMKRIAKSALIEMIIISNKFY